jgi:hypothetical protein
LNIIWWAQFLSLYTLWDSFMWLLTNII